MSRRCTSLAGDPSPGHRSIKAKPLESIIILGAPVCKALQRPVLALISLIDHVITPLLAQSSAATRGLLLRPVVPKHSNITSLLCISGVNGSAAATAAHTPAATGCVFVLFANNIRTAAKWARSLSARRAWIEIRLILYCALILSVALRKESVDRNETC